MQKEEAILDIWDLEISIDPILRENINGGMYWIEMWCVAICKYIYLYYNKIHQVCKQGWRKVPWSIKQKIFGYGVWKKNIGRVGLNVVFFPIQRCVRGNWMSLMRLYATKLCVKEPSCSEVVIGRSSVDRATIFW